VNRYGELHVDAFLGIVAVTAVNSHQCPPVCLKDPTKLPARHGFHTAISTTSASASLACGSASMESQPSMDSWIFCISSSYVSP
jgi:hypothetical protein